MTARRSRPGWAWGWLLALVVIGLVAWRLALLQRSDERLSAGPTGPQALFEQALQRGLLVAGKNRELHLLPADELLARRQRGEVVAADDERLFKQLHHSPAGDAVRAELRRWNRSRAPVAVRDNSAAFAGVSHDGWSAYRCEGGRLALDGVVPEDYGFLHQGRLRTGFGPWQVAGGSDCVEFRTRFFSPRPTALSVWLVGEPDDDAAATPVGPEDYPEPQACDPRPIEPQAAIQVLDEAGWRSLGAHAWVREVRVRLRPVGYRGLRVAGLRIAIDPEDCGFLWLGEEAGQGVGAGRRASPVSLLTSDGVALLDERGRPTAEARELGLLALVGYGADDAQSLAGLFARSALPATGLAVHLTLDSRVQAVAQEELQAGVEAMFPADEDLFTDQRRAALVVMNGRGAILAAAGLPAVPVQVGRQGRPQDPLQDWDLAAFAHSYPAIDPLRVRAWEPLLDKHDAPGMTLAPVTALAAMAQAGDASKVAPKVAGMLRGWDAETFTAETGLAADATTYDPYAEVPTGSPDGQRRELVDSGGGVGGEPESFLTVLGNRALNAPECQAPARGPAAEGHVGLAAAMRDGFDLWFARLALMVDAPVMAKLDHKIRPETPSRFTRALRRLGFGDTVDLFADAPGYIATAARPRLPAARVALWADDPRPARWNLVRNAVGQGIAVAPLQMARLAASVATGARVQPYLAADWNGDAVSVAPGPALAGDLGRLRAGMRAVVQVGSAAQAFAQVFSDRLDSPLRCNTYAQTGTGELGSRQRGRGLQGINSAWFVGWYQPETGEPLAFACRVSHAHGADSHTGGQVCAPIVARLLERLYPEAGGSVSADEAGGEAPEVVDPEQDAEPDPEPDPELTGTSLPETAAMETMQ